MELWELLGIEPGITAVIGSGGKSTTLAVLSEELQKKGKVICCTTTHFFPLEGMPLLRDAEEGELRAALQEHSRVCLGDTGPQGKLGASKISMAHLRELADYVLVEADGSRCLPIKAHRPYEPVIPEGTTQRILLVGASGFGRPIREAVHCPELFCERSGASPTDLVTPEAVARAMQAEALGDKVFVNQAEGPERMALARRLAEAVDRPVFAGSLQRRIWECLS